MYTYVFNKTYAYDRTRRPRKPPRFYRYFYFFFFPPRRRDVLFCRRRRRVIVVNFRCVTGEKRPRVLLSRRSSEHNTITIMSTLV